MSLQDPTIEFDNDENDDEDSLVLLRGSRAQRQGPDRAAPKKKLSDATRDLLREAAKSEAQTDVFTPTFKGKKFEAEWLLGSLGDFYFNHLIADILSEVKGGKEANVYCCSVHPQMSAQLRTPGLLAAKVYRPRMFRNLKNDADYRAGGSLIGGDGKTMLKEREQRAVAGRTKAGLQMLHQSWLSNEVGVLKRLTEAGAQVPKTYAVNGNAILMDYLGTRQTAASTLNHVALAPGEARALFDQVVGNIRLMLRAEVVHGDLSAYNILYWQGLEGPDDFLIIDFPQATNPWKNPNSRRFFSRDVTRVCEYFAGQGVPIRDFEALAADLWQQAYGTTGDLLS